MIVSSIFSALTQLIFKPQIMAPLIFLFIIIAGITEVSGVIIEKPLTEMTLGSAILEGQNPIAFIIFNYPLEILGIIIIGTIMIMIGIIAVMSVARISKGEGFIKAINSSVLDYPKAFALAIIFWAVFLIIDGALFLASWISLIEINTGTILAVIFLIITLIVFVKLIFTLPALTKYPIKKAFQESWAFTKSPLRPLILIIIAGIIGYAIAFIFLQIGIVFGGSFDEAIYALGQAIGATFFITVITDYYYSK